MRTNHATRSDADPGPSSRSLDLIRTRGPGTTVTPPQPVQTGRAPTEAVAAPAGILLTLRLTPRRATKPDHNIGTIDGIPGSSRTCWPAYLPSYGCTDYLAAAQEDGTLDAVAEARIETLADSGALHPACINPAKPPIQK